MNYIYNKYFQKSKAFLYPLLGIKKTSTINPIETYISWGDKVSSLDYKLILVYKVDSTDAFRAYERLVLFKNPLFLEYYECDDNKNVYVFTFEKYTEDWDNFLVGHYSKLSSVFKKNIEFYYGAHTIEWEYVKSYLYPSQHFELYAKLLTSNDRDYHSMLKILNEVQELCDKIDEQKEDCKEIIRELIVQ